MNIPVARFVQPQIQWNCHLTKKKKERKKVKASIRYQASQ